MKKMLITNIGMLATPKGFAAKSGKEQGEIEILKNAWVLLEDGMIAKVGTGKPEPAESAEIIDAEGNLVTPGLVDAHTHLIFGGWRQNELGMKLHGASYLDIAAQGGGILSTLTATHAASEEELYDKAYEALDEMMQLGVTTAEAKSGYGLDTENELKELRVIRGAWGFDHLYDPVRATDIAALDMRMQDIHDKVELLASQSQEAE